MKFINHIIEPTRLLVTWQSSDENLRSRYVIAELIRDGEKVTLKYLPNSSDFIDAQSIGFEPYPAFRSINEDHDSGVLDAFMRRLPPKSRGDYSEYLKGFRINPETDISDFALLGYTGARLPSDGFAIINPFDDVDEPFEFLTEATGYRYYKGNLTISPGDRASFMKEYDADRGEDVIKIVVNNNLIGYVTRALLPTFKSWMSQGQVKGAWVEKINGALDRPIAYVYVKITP